MKLRLVVLAVLSASVFACSAAPHGAVASPGGGVVGEPTVTGAGGDRATVSVREAPASREWQHESRRDVQVHSHDGAVTCRQCR